MGAAKTKAGETLALYGALITLSVLFRWPALLNAGTVDSDAAIVGIQARHILHGEWAPFLYGSGYQTSVDSAVAALFFSVLGASSLALMLSTLGGHVALACLVLATLRRRLAPIAAFVTTLPLVFTSSPLHTYILNPPRQASLTLAFLALFVLDGATRRPSAGLRALHYATGSAVASLACFADPYALLLLPPLVLFGVVSAWQESPGGARERALAIGPVIAGAALGLVPFYVLVHRPDAVHGETTLTRAVLPHNWELFRTTCLPWLLGAKVFVPRVLLGYVPWRPGPLLGFVALLGASLFVAAIASAGVALFRPEVPVAVRRLGAFGLGVAILTVGSFLGSVMVMDLFSSRYLAALVLASPFAILPLAHAWGARRVLALLAPYLFSAGLAGWLGYGDEVDGLRIVDLPGHGAADEQRLGELLRARGITSAVADYWVSYRLTFLYGESIAVVPIHAREDRYAPYRVAYEAARTSAYVFDPKRSREDLDAMKAEAFGGPHAWGVPVDELHVGELTAVVFERPAASASTAP